MALEDILRALEDNAEARVSAINTEADQRVSEITSEAEREAARTRRIRLKKVEDTIKSECTSIVYSASLKAKDDLIRAEEELVDEAFSVAEKRLAGVSSADDYSKILGVLLDECLEIFSGEVILQVLSEDKALVEKMMAKKGVPYKFSDVPLEASGGVVASSVDGTIIVSNSFESRLEKAKDKLRLEVSNTLFGD